MPQRVVPPPHLFAVLLLLAVATLAGCSPRLDWRDVHGADGDWVVALPDRPKASVREVDLGEGLRVSMAMTASGVGPTLFAVGSATLPPGACLDAAQCDRLLDRLARHLARNVGAAAEPRAVPRVTAPAGRQVRAARATEARGRATEGSGGASGGREARLAARLFVVDDRLYQVVAIGAPEALGDEALDTFFTSFRLPPR